MIPIASSKNLPGCDITFTRCSAPGEPILAFLGLHKRYDSLRLFMFLCPHTTLYPPVYLESNYL